MNIKLYNLSMNKEKGYTLVEVLLVVFFLILIGQIGYKNYLEGEKVSRDLQRRADIEEIQRRLEVYYARYWEYPNELKFGMRVADPFGGEFTYGKNALHPEDLPNDPVNEKPYVYSYKVDKDHLVYEVCAGGLESSDGSYCLGDDKREKYKEEIKKLNQEGQ